MIAIKFLLVALAIFVVAVQSVQARVATAYSGAGQMNRTGRNACGFNPRKLSKKWNTYYAALNERDFKKMGRPCGKCLKVKGRKGTVTVKIVDICPSKYCKRGHVDLSSPALKKATGYSWDKKPVKFSVTGC
jgi:expansin (peptidoglycan-binding protein)